jgi:hypothetical protein
MGVRRRSGEGSLDGILLLLLIAAGVMIWMMAHNGGKLPGLGESRTTTVEADPQPQSQVAVSSAYSQSGYTPPAADYPTQAVTTPSIACNLWVVHEACSFSEFSPPPVSGNAFVALAVDITNYGSRFISVNEFDFTLLMDGVAYRRDLSALMALSNQCPKLRPVVLAPGGRCWGTVAFQWQISQNQRRGAYLIWCPTGVPRDEIQTTYCGAWQYD